MADLEMIETVSRDHSRISTRSNAVASTIGDLEAGIPSNDSGRLARLRRYLHGLYPQVEQPKESIRCECITRSLDDEPMGYPQLATFQSSDRVFMQFRCFGYLHARVLSDMQYEIEQKEKLLDELDRWELEEGVPSKLRCKDRDDRQVSAGLESEFDQTRPQLLAELRPKLLEYDEMLLKTKEVFSLQRPRKRDYQSVKSFMAEVRPIVEDEEDFILKKEDIVSLATGRESSSFDELMKGLLYGLDKILGKYFRCKIIERIFRTPEQEVKTKDKSIHYYCPSRVNTLINFIITLVIFILMITPVMAMYRMTNLSRTASPFQAMGILIAFTLLFGWAMAALTKATRQELFAASAAYCAVLVVFISNFSAQNVNVLPST